jgi:hypothetical protein
MKPFIYTTLIFMILFAGIHASSQVNKYTYGISMNGKSVGELNIVQKAFDDSLIIDISTVIVTRMIFLFKVVSFDKTIFHNGKLQYSYTSRQINKGHKSTTVTRVMGETYQSDKEGSIKQLTRSILHNMSSLYLSEPVNFKEVYSDVFQDFVKISYVEPHRYKLRLPDGNTNEYYYANGICRRIKVNHTLFNAQMDLKSVNKL